VFNGSGYGGVYGGSVLVECLVPIDNGGRASFPNLGCSGGPPIHMGDDFRNP
jgi:hypothetical protein